MLIEQNIGFELRGPGTLAVHALLSLVNFVKKQKSLRKIVEWFFLRDFCFFINFFMFFRVFAAKTLQEAMFLTSPYLGQINHLQLKFNYDLEDF